MESTFYLMVAAVALSSVALVANALASLGIYRTVRKLQQDVTPLIPEAHKAIADAQRTIQETSRDVREITDQAKAVMESIERQVDNFEATRNELKAHLKIQGERVEMVIEDILSRIQEVVSVLHGSVLRPVREVSGIVAGVRAAVETLLMGRRPTVDRVTHDEEMFI